MPKSRKELEAENRELRAQLGWDSEYSEVAELREMLDRCREDREDLEAAVRIERDSLREREEAFGRHLELSRERSDAFMQAIEAAFALLRLR